MKSILIITHNGTFHADEVAATALLVAFYLKSEDKYDVIRMPHQHNIDDYIKNHKYYDKYFVLDIGKVLDPDNLKFDHHQFSSAESPYSSAGLIWKWLKEQNIVSQDVAVELDPVIKNVDMNDIGVRPAEPGELSWVISNLNDQNAYSENQFYMFETAVQIVSQIFDNIKERYQNFETAKQELEKSNKIKLHSDDEFQVLEICDKCEHAQKSWMRIINDLPLLNDVDIVINYKEISDEWTAQTVATKENRFVKRGRSINLAEPYPEKIKFVHKQEFFMVAETRDALINYLKIYAK